MKRLGLLAFLILFGSVVRAADPVSVVQGPLDSRYIDTNTTVSVSSTAVATIPAVEGYRQLKLQNSTSFFYVEDGTAVAATVRSSGLSVAADAIETIENNRLIGLVMPAGVATATIRYRERRKIN